MLSLPVSQMRKLLILFLVLSFQASLPLSGYAATGAICAKQAGACCRNCPVLHVAGAKQPFCAEACPSSSPTPALPASIELNPPATIVITVLSPILTALRPSFVRYNASPPIHPLTRLDILCSRQL